MATRRCRGILCSACGYGFWPWYRREHYYLSFIPLPKNEMGAQLSRPPINKGIQNCIDNG
jgi:hypothetical protein